MPGYIHHVQWSVSDLANISSQVRLQYGLRAVARREREIVLQSGSVVFLLSQAGTEGDPVCEEREAESYPWLHTGRRGGQTDCVFNICLEVGDVRQSYQRMTEAGSLSISPPREISDEEGVVTVAVVSSPCSQVIHSLVNTGRYYGHFLPGFTGLEAGEDSERETGDLITHIDHVTLVCEAVVSFLGWVGCAVAVRLPGWRSLVVEPEGP